LANGLSGVTNDDIYQQRPTNSLEYTKRNNLWYIEGWSFNELELDCGSSEKRIPGGIDVGKLMTKCAYCSRWGLYQYWHALLWNNSPICNRPPPNLPHL